MFSKKDKNKSKTVDTTKVNEVLNLSKKILEIVYFLVIIFKGMESFRSMPE